MYFFQNYFGYNDATSKSPEQDDPDVDNNLCTNPIKLSSSINIADERYVIVEKDGEAEHSNDVADNADWLEYMKWWKEKIATTSGKVFIFSGFLLTLSALLILPFAILKGVTIILIYIHIYIYVTER